MNIPAVFWWLLAALNVLLCILVVAHGIHIHRLHKKKKEHDN
jgi:hypothetical protein